MQKGILLHDVNLGVYTMYIHTNIMCLASHPVYKDTAQRKLYVEQQNSS